MSPNSPDLNRAEHLWDHHNGCIHSVDRSEGCAGVGRAPDICNDPIRTLLSFSQHSCYSVYKQVVTINVIRQCKTQCPNFAHTSCLKPMLCLYLEARLSETLAKTQEQLENRTTNRNSAAVCVCPK